MENSIFLIVTLSVVFIRSFVLNSYKHITLHLPHAAIIDSEEEASGDNKMNKLTCLFVLFIGESSETIPPRDIFLVSR